MTEEGCAALWIAAVDRYRQDCCYPRRDGGQALRDLQGDRELLARLCKPLDADPELVAAAIRQRHGL